MNYFLTLHIIAFVCWFAGLFYLPRLFVYHTENPHQMVKDQLIIMGERLYCYIMTPAMTVTLLSGILLAFAYFSSRPSALGWLWLKLFLVMLLIGFHFICGYFIRALKHNACDKSGRFFRVFNEVPTLLLILIVALAVLKPF